MGNIMKALGDRRDSSVGKTLAQEAKEPAFDPQNPREESHEGCMFVISASGRRSQAEPCALCLTKLHSARGMTEEVVL